MNAATQHLASEYASIGARHAQTIAAVKSGLRRKPDIRRLSFCEDYEYRRHVWQRSWDAPEEHRAMYQALHTYLNGRAWVRRALRGESPGYEDALRHCAAAKRWLKREADKLRAEICR